MKLRLLLCQLLIGLSVLPSAQAAQPTNASVYIIPIHGMIEPALIYVIRRGVTAAEESHAKAVIFTMNTPGGTIDAASEIVHLIQSISVPTYTFVEKDAYSAGAIIALATKEIYMAPGSVIGDAMPILMSPLGGVQETPEAIQEKIVAGVAAKIRAVAEQGGHDKDLAEAMVRREKGYKIGDVVICPPGQLLTLTDVEAGRVINGRRLLSAGTVANIDELLRQKGLAGAKVNQLQVTAAEHVARFIAALAPIFLIAGLLGIYLEIKSPGLIFPGLFGALALVIFFWGHHIAGLAGLEELTIFLAGFVLLLVEVIFFPTYGLIGVVGSILILWALLSSMTEHLPNADWHLTIAAFSKPLIKIVYTIVGTFIGVLIIGRYFPRTGIFNKIALPQTTSAASGYTANPANTELVGSIGTTETDLHPAGTGIFNKQRLDIISHGEYIQSGQKVRICEAHGNRLVVEAISETK